MKLETKDNIIKYSLIGIVLVTIMSFGITMISGNHKITDILAVVGTCVLLALIFTLIVASLFNEFKKGGQRFIILSVAFLIILGVAYILITN